MSAYDPTDLALAEAPTALLTERPYMPEMTPVAPAEEPTGGVIVAERAPAEPEALPGPPIPPPLPLRNVSGTYVGVSGAFELDLRVDADGARPMHRVSGDFGAIKIKYFGEYFKSKTRRDPCHSFIHTSGVTIFLIGFSFGISIF